MLLVSLVFAVAAGAQLPADAAVRLVEKSANLDIARRVQARLAGAGVPIVMTRLGDETVSLASRTSLANARRVDAYVSIHNNASRNRRAGGSEVYHQVAGGDSERLGALIRDRLARSPGLPSSLRFRTGDHGDYYYVLRTTKMPAVIVEGAYVSNPGEARRLASPAFRQALADSIAVGILDYQRTLTARPLPQTSAPLRVTAPALPPPGEATGDAINARTVALSWTPALVATAYDVYRDGTFLGTVNNPLLDGEVSAPGRLGFTDIWAAPGQRYVYEIAAAANLNTAAVESAPARVTVQTPPIVVALDPGHGGVDPGAIGSY